jgi:hypothetical protein
VDSARVRGFALAAGEPRAREVLDAGTRIVVHARAIVKRRVGSWSSYWYLVSAGAGGTLANVWVYGEFVRLTEESSLPRLPTAAEVFAAADPASVRRAAIR